MLGSRSPDEAAPTTSSTSRWLIYPRYFGELTAGSDHKTPSATRGKLGRQRFHARLFVFRIALIVSLLACYGFLAVGALLFIAYGVRAWMSD